MSKFLSTYYHITNLSTVFINQRIQQNINNGIILLRGALENSDLKNNPNSKDCLIIKSNLAILLMSIEGDNESLNESKKLLEDCLCIFEETTPSDLNSINKTRMNLSAVLDLLGGEENLLYSKELLVEAIKYAEEIHGPASLITVKRKFNLSRTYHSLGGQDNINNAIEIIKEVLETYKNQYGNDNLETASVKSALAYYLMSRNDVSSWQESTSLFEDCLSVYNLNISPSRPEVISVKWCLCISYIRLNIKYDSATYLIKDIYRAFREKKYPIKQNEKEILDLGMDIYCKVKAISKLYVNRSEFNIWLNS